MKRCVFSGRFSLELHSSNRIRVSFSDRSSKKSRDPYVCIVSRLRCFETAAFFSVVGVFRSRPRTRRDSSQDIGYRLAWIYRKPLTIDLCGADFYWARNPGQGIQVDEERNHRYSNIAQAGAEEGDRNASRRLSRFTGLAQDGAMVPRQLWRRFAFLLGYTLCFADGDHEPGLAAG